MFPLVASVCVWEGWGGGIWVDCAGMAELRKQTTLGTSF